MLSEKMGLTYQETKQVGDRLIAMNLAEIRPLRMAHEFAGSGIVLNNRGKQVKQAVLVSHS